MNKFFSKRLVAYFILTQCPQIFGQSLDFWEPVTPIPNAIFASLEIDSAGYIYSGTRGSGLFISSDNGNSWSDSILFCFSIVEALTLNLQGDIFMGDNGCVLSSSDHGLNWQLVKYAFGCQSVLITSSSHIFIGQESDWNVGKLARSTDNGITWLYFTFPDYEVAYSLISDLNGFLYAGTNDGIFRSLNNGDLWDSVNTGLTKRFVRCLINLPNSNILAGTSNGGIFITTNSGDSWYQSSLPICDVRDITLDRNGFIWAATNIGVVKSVDNGNNWIQVNKGLSNINIRTISINPNDYIFVGADSGKIFKSINPTTSISFEYMPINDFMLYQNYPNPFNPSTRIQYQVSSNSYITLKVYDVLGNEVATLVDEYKPAGSYEVEFNASSGIWSASGGLASGIYFYQLKAGSFVQTKKMIYLK